MRSFLSLLVLAFASVVPYAGAQSLTLTTPDTTLATPDDPLGDLSQPGSVGDSTDGLGLTGGNAVDSGTTSTRLSPGKAFRTRFDRLPLRLEGLLERIELGRNLRANLRRLEQMFESLSVRERSRLLRLLNAEIHRLRAGGVSPMERRRIQRLVRTRAALTAPAAAPASNVAGGTSATSETALAPGTGPRTGEGVLRAFVAASKAQPSEGATPPSRGAGKPSGEADDGGFALSPLLIVLGAVLIAIIAGLAIKEERAA
jgi:hypothetical protein